MPEDIKLSYVTGRWTEYMQRVLAHLHETGVSVADMRRVMQTLPYTQGMEQLLQELSGGSIGGQAASCIILSDRWACWLAVAGWCVSTSQHSKITCVLLPHMNSLAGVTGEAAGLLPCVVKLVPVWLSACLQQHEVH